MDSDLPLGVVTFLLTDVEASTRIWRDSPRAAALLARQSELIAAAIAQHGGVRPAGGEGDSLLAVFVRPGAALAAALDAQRALAAEPWPEGESLRVRMAIHTGEAELRDERNYGGLELIRAARLRALARGGQVLVSNATVALASERLPDRASFAELGSVSLPGLAQPERVSQLCHPELPAVVAELRRAASLPAWATPLVGREQERRDVVALLAESRLVTLTGAGGSGKTRLAHAVAEDLAERFPDGVARVELARLSSGELVAGAVLMACGVREAPGVSALDVLVHSLARNEILIVLDNCEHLLAASAELAFAAVRAGPGVRVLATSREPLGVAGETSWHIPSLGLPEPDESDPERIAGADAVRLFVARARAARPELQLDTASARLVARVCRRLDGIPLALELAAARVRALSLERLAAGLDDRFRPARAPPRRASARSWPPSSGATTCSTRRSASRFGASRCSRRPSASRRPRRWRPTTSSIGSPCSMAWLAWWTRAWSSTRAIATGCSKLSVSTRSSAPTTRGSSRSCATGTSAGSAGARAAGTSTASGRPTHFSWRLRPRRPT